jgi:hypothetical protein
VNSCIAPRRAAGENPGHTTETAMICPACNHLNAATSVRCENCHETLIHDAVGHSPAYRRGEAMVEYRIHGHVGALVGAGLGFAATQVAWLPESPDDHAVRVGVMAGAAAGLVLARLFLFVKRRR